MNEIKVFSNNEFGNVRVIEQNGEPWFVGKDVADILGYDQTSNMVKRLDSEDFISSKLDGMNMKSVLINESGLYSAILGSKLPSAKKFKHWVTSDVLPSIRKHGMYAADELLDNPDMFIKVLENLRDEKAKRIELEGQVELQKPKVIFADAVSTSNRSILIGELSKLLKQNGYDIGQNRLFEKLRNDGYLIKGKQRSDRNMPTQRAMELGLFEIKETAINHSDGHTSITKTPKVTGKGQIYFVNRFLGRQAQ